MNPVLWILVFATVTTVGLLLERRSRSRLLSLDEWAERQGRPVVRDAPLALLTEIEPISFLPPIVAIARFLPARSEVEPALLLGSCGTGHRPVTFLCAISQAPALLPHARVLPQNAHDVPGNLGFVAQEAPELPGTHRLEAFSPLAPQLVAALAVALGARPDFRPDFRPELRPELRIELRPGRVLVAARGQGPDDAELVSAITAQLLLGLGV